MTKAGDYHLFLFPISGILFFGTLLPLAKILKKSAPAPIIISLLHENNNRKLCKIIIFFQYSLKIPQKS